MSFILQSAVLHQLLRSLWCRLLHHCFFNLRFDLHEIQCNSSFVSLTQGFFSSKCIAVSVMVNVFSLFANSDINCTLCFCFFLLCLWMLQLIIEYKLVCPRKLELDSSPTSCCSIVVVHCASLPIKNILWSFAVAPFCVVRWYPSWVLRCGVWDWGGMTMRGKER